MPRATSAERQTKHLTQRVPIFGALAALILAACACGGTPSSQGSNTGSLRGSTIVITGEAGSVLAGYQTLFSEFTNKTGIKVKYQEGVLSSELEQIRAQGDHPSTDVFLATPLQELQYPDLWRSIDSSEVPNLKDLPADLTQDKLGVATGCIPNGIEYNAKVFKQKGWAPPTSYMDFFDPKYKGHVVFYPGSFPTMEEWLAQVSSEFGGSPSNMGPVFDKLKQLKPQLYAIVSTPTQLDQAFIQQNGWIALNNSTRIRLLNQQTNGDVDIAYPSEGILWLQGKQLVPKNDPNPQGAYAWLNFFLSQEVQTQVASLVNLSPVATGASVPDSLRKWLPDPNSQKGYYPDWPNLKQYFSAWVQQWDQIFTT